MIKLCIFDVDGTIWDTTGVVAEAWNKAIDSTFPQVPHVTADILKGQFGKTMDVIGQNLFGVLSKDEQSILLEKSLNSIPCPPILRTGWFC